MTSCEWIYIQTFLTDLALDHADTPGQQEFVRKRLQELQGRIRFEQRMLGRPHPEPWALDLEQPDWSGH